jgi:YD repeat-containing protein
MTVGTPTDLSGTRGLSKAVVTVEEIAEEAECPTKAATAKNGQFVAVKLSAQRTDAAQNFGLAVYDWLTVDQAGKERPASAGLVTGLCITDGTALRLAYDASGRTAGTLLLDAPADVVSILARNPNATPPVTLTIEMPPR